MMQKLFAFAFGLVVGALAVLVMTDRRVDLNGVGAGAGEAVDAVGREAREFTLKQRVMWTLSWQKDFSYLGDIEVDVDGGRVTLGGTVDTPEQRHRAEVIVRGVDGVEEIVNRIEVDPGGGAGR